MRIEKKKKLQKQKCAASSTDCTMSEPKRKPPFLAEKVRKSAKALATYHYGQQARTVELD